jgi:hypothetical protein
LLATFHKLGKPSLPQKQGRQEVYLLGHISYIRIESSSIGIRSVICLTFGHMLMEGSCQPLLAFYDQ